jgi:signal transduction histidine kinase/DNA-binding response OmpR family regulator
MGNKPRSGFSGTGFRRAAGLCALAAALLFPGALSGAEKEARKVVRVPCQEFNRLMVVDEDGDPVSGYAYDFIQTIATYAGWDVEYVPCASFSDGARQIQEGVADVFYEVSYTEERARKMLFPDEPMGFEYYYLYAAQDNTSITPDDYATLDGRTVGVTTGTVLLDFLKTWSEKRNLRFNIVEFDDIEEKEAALRAGGIDLDLEVSMVAKSDLSAVEKVGACSYFLVAGKERPDLVEDINFAMEKVLNNDLYFFSRLQERYFSDTVLGRNLSKDEKEWIDGHSVLRVGYFDDYLPFCAMDERGRPAGAAIDAIREIVRRLGLEDRLAIEFVCYDSQKAGYKAVESGEIDLMIPAYISNSVRRDYRIAGGRVLMTLACDFVFRGGFDLGDGAGLRIGVNRNNLMQYYYTRDSHPREEIVFFDDIRGCLDGVLDGTVDGTFLNGLRTGALLKTEKYQPLDSMQGRQGFEFHMAFAEDNLGLLLLMNRGLAMLESHFIHKAAYAYASRIHPPSLLDLLRRHIVAAIAAGAALAALLVLLVLTRLSNRKLAGINRALTEYAETIEEQRLKEADLRNELEKNQHQLEDALHMAQAANRAKTTFLSNMSHDIRTPMNAIIGFTGLAASHIDEPEHVQEYLATIAHSSEHLLSLINDVLDMSRIESGHMTLNEKVESLADILHALRDIVHADVQAKQHNFYIDTVDVRDEHVWCDKMRLNQVLFNLVSNAIKYTPPGGTISLRIVQKTHARAGHASYEFRCRDNGIGMDRDFAKTIFDPFTREATSTVSGIQGTGLGMAIAKNIVDMMGGTIAVQSDKGRGTEFIVALDFKLAADHPAADPAIPELKGLRSLVVDDDVTACQSIADMLRASGMRSEWCVSGKEAVIRTEESLRHGDSFKVYVIDWLMPDMNGIETVRRIRKIVGQDASIIILTAYDWVDIEKEAREAGVTEFLSKPLFPSDLHRVLLHACGKPLPPDAAEAAPATPAVPTLRGKHILMVDDSPLNLKVGTLLLREQGAIVDTAQNGQLAVDTIREKTPSHYDFIIMDVQMPIMDGYTATAAIRALPGGDKLKIIAFSANAFEEDKEKSLRAGMDGHLAKPLKISDFLEELRRFS